MKIIPINTCNNIYILIDTGLPIKQITSQTKVSYMIVQRIQANYHPSIQKPQAGRKQKLSEANKRYMAHIS